ncbi:bifunctional diguanylate cyclase/phosphodiesterase [Neobacillus jeddahensis]|uniref:bifunctional diguanylate cyclase/phosphodiesterase n=1 Tax=Neobacillus jeddahensis TaxID=1461580 RepID=UPI000693EA0B|nr:GGDEF and EAL domain-containing protein [Neobacillus jeddahensis]
MSMFKDISVKTWIILVFFYLFPPVLDYIDFQDQSLQNVFWYFYLIPALIIAFHKGSKYGGLATAVSSLFFLMDQSLLQPEGISKQEVIILFEMTTINLLVSLFVGYLVKNNRLRRIELSKANTLLESVFHHLDIGIWSIGKRENFLISKGIEDIYGMSREKELRDHHFWKKSIHPDDLVIVEQIDQKWKALEDYEYEYRIIRSNGDIRWIRDRGIPVFSEDGKHVRYDGTNVDITKQKELEIDLKESEERYKTLVENSIVGVFMVQNMELVYVNPWFSTMLGLTKEELLGTRLTEYLNEADRNRIISHFQLLLEEKEAHFIDLIQTNDLNGAVKYLEIQARLTSMDGDTAIIGVAIDVTDKKKANEKLEYVAYHDPLTGLPNKHYLMDLSNQYYQSTSLGNPGYILCLNLDRFKLINDSFGHRVGDQLITLVANRIANCSLSVGKVLRGQGDEFIVYLPDTNEQQALAHATTLLDDLSKPYYLAEQDIRITVSIGIAPFEMNETLEDLVQKAGSALHFAKDFGGNQYQLYSLEIGKQVNRRLQLEQRLRKALEENNLSVVYQPKLHLFSNRITGMEALIRWNDPILGAVSPVEFIPIAEDTGLIIAIGKWVLETACKQTKEWERSGYPPILVCVNISSRQFLQDDFVKMVEQVLKETSLSPENLNLEITESIALYNIDDAIEKLLQIKQLGVSISLDDFGTGYSSMSYLKLLPIDFLKIDRAFTSGIFKDKNDLAIIDSIISLSHSLGMRVVAEGVEDENQLNALSNLSCDEIQGYYYARPMPVPQFKEFLDETMVGMSSYLIEKETNE